MISKRGPLTAHADGDLGNDLRGIKASARFAQNDGERSAALRICGFEEGVALELAEGGSLLLRGEDSAGEETSFRNGGNWIGRWRRSPSSGRCEFPGTPAVRFEETEPVFGSEFEGSVLHDAAHATGFRYLEA